jgi:hypothetical protein
LTGLSSIGIDSEKEKGSIVLTEREIKGVPISRFSGAAIDSPADGVPDRDSKIPEGKRDIRIEEGDANRQREKESNERINQKDVQTISSLPRLPLPLFVQQNTPIMWPVPILKKCFPMGRILKHPAREGQVSKAPILEPEE